jgi:hypothetical protein
MIHLLGFAAVLAGICASTVFAQADSNQRDRQKNETTMTGCLNKDSSGGYTLTDEKTGAKTTVTGTADLEKHSANHKVTLTGTEKPDAAGKKSFEVTKIQHISPSCTAPSQ